MPWTASASAPDADLLVAVIHGNPQARQIFSDRLFKQLVRIAGSIAPDLKERQLHEDAAIRATELLFSGSHTTFQPGRSSVYGYLKGIVRTAVRDIRAEYTPPGRPTRVKKDEAGVGELPAPVSLDAPVEAEGEITRLLDTIPAQDATRGYEQVQDAAMARYLLNQVRTKLDTRFEKLLMLIYREGLTFSEAAACAHVDRMTARRHVDRLAGELRYATAA